VSKELTKVNSLGSNSRPLIALPSPYAHLETGLRTCPPEKSLGNDCIRYRGVRSPGPVCLGIIAKYGHYSRIWAQSERNFSAAQTAWRRERDSNPRSGFAALSLDVSVSYR
jgi:hypothetical protein